MEWPDWALQNYLISFPKIFPSINCNLHGAKVDTVKRADLRAEAVLEKSKTERSLEIMTNTPYYNPNSPPQTVKLMKALGVNVSAADKKGLQQFSDSHPVNTIIAENITEFRKANKAVSTYFDVDLFNDRLYYSLDPFGTDTSRLASKASEFWCGTQIQNIPPYAREMIIPDEGYIFGAVDFSQSESWCTGVISEDENLLDALHNSKDFHTRNCAMFFGIPEETLYIMKEKEPELYKKYRNKIGKRINHGANYNMGWRVLFETMGSKAVIEAAKLLGLSPNWGFRKICEYLLGLFDAVYPRIRDKDTPGAYYYEVIREIHETNKLVGANGWTRWCFDDPSRSKRALNKYVAHCPQSLSVQIVNKAFEEVWYRYQYKTPLIRMMAQIHDELWFQFLPHQEEEVFTKVQAIMHSPCQVKGRTLIIPTTRAVGADNWKQCK
jgi:DNA polymerase I-like protein with 3'-5' exonuclease and polymerase domains